VPASALPTNLLVFSEESHGVRGNCHDKKWDLCKGKFSNSLLGPICGADNVIADALTIQSGSTSE
jgi:hypothetical protein